MESVVDFLIRNQAYYLTPLALLGLFLLWIFTTVIVSTISESRGEKRAERRKNESRLTGGAPPDPGRSEYYRFDRLERRAGRTPGRNGYEGTGSASSIAWTLSSFLGLILVLAISTGFVWAGWRLIAGSGVIQPTAALEPPAVETPSPSSTKLLVLVHGWNGTADATWRLLPDLVRSDEAFRRFDLWVINYPTFQVRRNLNIGQMARWLNETMVRDGYYNKYQEIYVVAHSMGGLIAREMLLENRLARDNKPYKSLIEIATPHQGADLGGLLAALGLSKGFSDDLTPGSSMLLALRDKWNSLKDRPKTYCLTSPHDSVVSVDSAIFQCDEYLQYPQWSHTDMVKPSSATDNRYRTLVARIRKIEGDLASRAMQQ